MGSKELKDEILNIANGHSEKARECIKNKNLEGFEYWMKKKWEVIPNPKREWEESFRVAKSMITFYIQYQVNYEQAELWLETLRQLDEHQQQHPGEVSLMKGKLLFEQKKFEDAKIYFDKAYHESQGHCFGSGDAKYLEFYQNPGKYLAK